MTKIPKNYKPNKNALPALLNPEAEEQRLRSIDEHQRYEDQLNRASRNIDRLLFGR